VSTPLPLTYLARHGETAWTISGQHTGLTDLPLTERGESNAKRLGRLIGDDPFTRVFCSPLLRTRRTCELAGFAERAEILDDLVEWNYGQYEGITTAEIRKERPGWDIFRDGCPGGESPAEIAARADRVIAQMRAIDGNTLLFSSGHFFRVMTARWLGLAPTAGHYFFLGTATLSILGYDHNLNEPALRLWNDDRHVVDCANVFQDEK
jgi:probable phosphoglycerate mutase